MKKALKKGRRVHIIEVIDEKWNLWERLIAIEKYVKPLSKQCKHKLLSD